MIICGTNKKNLCEEYNCEVKDTENGICISFSSDDKEKVAKLQEMSKSCTTDCCSSDKDTKSCC